MSATDPKSALCDSLASTSCLGFDEDRVDVMCLRNRHCMVRTAAERMAAGYLRPQIRLLTSIRPRLIAQTSDWLH